MKIFLEIQAEGAVLFSGTVESPSAMAAIRLKLAEMRISETMRASVRRGLRIEARAENGKAESRKLNPEVWR